MSDSEISCHDFSDAESSGDETVINWSDARRYKLPFGKYKGKKLVQMVSKPKLREYLRYLLSWDELKPRTRANLQCAIDEYEKHKKTKATKKKK